MVRVALLLGAALCACSSVVGAPPVLRQHEGEEPHTPGPSQALTDAQLQAFIGQGVRELAVVLQPLCGINCYSLMVQPDRDLEWPLALLSYRAQAQYVIVYHPDEFRDILAHSELLAMQVIAHELGHYIHIAIAGAELDDRWRLEITADTVAGCALATQGARFQLERAAISAASSLVDSIDSRLDLVCGSDREHPAVRWQLEALDTGAQLCRSGVAPWARLEAEAADLRLDAQRAAEEARAWFPPFPNPCRMRHLENDLRTMRSRQ